MSALSKSLGVAGILGAALTATGTLHQNAQGALVTFDFSSTMAPLDPTLHVPYITANISNYSPPNTLDGVDSWSPLNYNGIHSSVNFLAFNGIWVTWHIEHQIVFTYTIAPGYIADLTSFSFTTYQGAGVDGGWSSALYGPSGYLTEKSDTTSGWGVNGDVTTVSLAGPAYTGVTGTFSFIIAPYKTHSNDIWGPWVGIDDIVLDGTISLIPEPASLALVAVGSSLALLRRRLA